MCDLGARDFCFLEDGMLEGFLLCNLDGLLCFLVGEVCRGHEGDLLRCDVEGGDSLVEDDAVWLAQIELEHPETFPGRARH